MKRIPIDKATPGQILAEKLTRHDGVLLASQGAEITEGLLRMLARQNIDTIVIEEDDVRTPEEIIDGYNTFLENLDQRFIRVSNQPVLQALRKTMIFLAEKDRDEALAIVSGPPENEDPPQDSSTHPPDQIDGNSLNAPVTSNSR